MGLVHNKTQEKREADVTGSAILSYLEIQEKQLTASIWQ